MIHALLGFVLIVLLFGLLLIVAVVALIYNKVQSLRSRLFGGGRASRPSGSGYRSARADARSRNGRQSSATVYDTRSDTARSRRIFSDDDGEYVSYREE